MATYVICKNRQYRKVDLTVCLANCKEQFECDNFNEAVCQKKAEQTKELAKEEPLRDLHGKPLCDFKGDDLVEDTDVKGESIENPPATPPDSKAQQLYQQFLSLKREIGTRWFDLGEVLEQIFKGRHYIPIGYTTWQDFCLAEMGVLDISFRTADYLRKTRVKCDEVGIEKEVAGRVGWTKIAQCLPVLTRENKDRWIEKASQKGMTTAKLNAQVRVALGKITEEESKILPEKMFFSLFKEQKEIVELALEVAGRVAASDKKGFLLADIICPEFLSAYPSESDNLTMPKAKVLRRILTDLEAGFKVKFTGEVVDVETGEILVESEVGGERG